MGLIVISEDSSSTSSTNHGGQFFESVMKPYSPWPHGVQRNNTRCRSSTENEYRAFAISTFEISWLQHLF